MPPRQSWGPGCISSATMLRTDPCLRFPSCASYMMAPVVFPKPSYGSQEAVLRGLVRPMSSCSRSVCCCRRLEGENSDLIPRRWQLDRNLSSIPKLVVLP